MPVCGVEVRRRVTCGKSCGQEYQRNTRKYRPKELSRYYDLKYQIKHRERILSNMRKKNSNNDTVIMRNKLYTRAKLLGRKPVHIPIEIVEFLVEKKQKGCAHCGSRNRLHLDHIQSVGTGGALFDTNNIQFLCDTCHKKKTQEENFRRLQKELEELELELKRRGFLKGTGHHLKKGNGNRRAGKQPSARADGV